ncbi:MAG: NAD kinase [Alteraurantiacibacter sp. bin_em_oilr2.035]|nr:NAD kinase [Aurantiacibacter atlanticus]MDF1834152.1 NAD kinase [Alteraurantiacibacter sp. bin_em_oilr2.035]
MSRTALVTKTGPANGALQIGTTLHSVCVMEEADSTGSSHSAPKRLALLHSQNEKAAEAAFRLADCNDFVSLEDAEAVIALGGDGFMLDTLHSMLDLETVKPVFGLNLGTVGFLMNRHIQSCDLVERVAKARRFTVSPLRMEAITQSGERERSCAINEVSLLRETRQTAKIEISVNGRVRISQLAGDGVLLSTPVGSTAYNLSANGPILPLDSRMLALTPISPFRPRRWPGAVLPDSSRVTFRVHEPTKRPVAVVADQKEVRDVAEVHVEIARDKEMTLLFDPGHALDERIVAEQFLT